MKIVCLSDTHTMGPQVVVPDGDVLVHTGDHTFRGNYEETIGALRWLHSLPHKKKVIIAGNHDFYFDDNSPETFRNCRITKPVTKHELLEHFPSIVYLEDESYELDGVKFYGSPWQPPFYDWAFNFRDDEHAREVWGKIPQDTQVLLTHAPPRGILDYCIGLDGDDRAGDSELARVVGDSLPELKLHAFGHLHEGYGIDHIGETTFVNASICTRGYEPTNAPVVIDLQKKLKAGNKPIVVDIEP